MEEVMTVHDIGQFKRRLALVATLVGVIFTITFSTHSNATLACCTIPPPPPCEIHPEMCA
jgi:hypothetical protein